MYVLQDVDVAEELVKRGYAQWVKEEDGATQNGEPVTSKVRFYYLSWYLTSGILLIEVLCRVCHVCHVRVCVCDVCGVCVWCVCVCACMHGLCSLSSQSLCMVLLESAICWSNMSLLLALATCHV